MKVVKRDGKFVEYEREKIRVAIHKANAEVNGVEKATDKEIQTIITYIESLGKKRILVEDIQDIIEMKLMELGHYELAKKYIVYRYTRTLVRKQTGTDSSILRMIKRTNREVIDEEKKIIASRQRDLIAGEVSKDLTKRILLPEKLVKAEGEGIFYFHDAEYFIQPIFHSSMIDMEDMLEHGTVIQGKKLESPKNFRVACTVLTQIINAVASSSYGGVCLNLNLGKYYQKSYQKLVHGLEKYKGKIDASILEEVIQDQLQKELKAGIQTIFYQLNTAMTTNGELPNVTFLLNTDGRENQLIAHELLRQKKLGMQDENGNTVIAEFPKIALSMECEKSLLEESLDCQDMIYFTGNNCPVWNGLLLKNTRFHQGFVSINLPQIAIEANKEENVFFELLKERLDLCLEALLCRHYALLGTYSDTCPIVWKYGAISRLESGKVIDELLKKSNISLGYVGLIEMAKLMVEKEEIHTFILKVLTYLKDTCDIWSEAQNIKFTLYGMKDSGFVSIDKEKYGKIKGITDKEAYTNFDEKLVNLKEIQMLSTGGIDVSMNLSKEELKKAMEQKEFLYLIRRKED